LRVKLNISEDQLLAFWQNEDSSSG